MVVVVHLLNLGTDSAPFGGVLFHVLDVLNEVVFVLAVLAALLVNLENHDHAVEQLLELVLVEEQVNAIVFGDVVDVLLQLHLLRMGEVQVVFFPQVLHGLGLLDRVLQQDCEFQLALDALRYEINHLVCQWSYFVGLL